jgi:hypothetical protein
MKISEILSSSDKWCQGYLAIDKDGAYVKPDSPQAVKWCLLGVFYKERADLKANAAIKERIRAAVGDKLMEWNDDPDRTFEEVRSIVLESEVER